MSTQTTVATHQLFEPAFATRIVARLRRRSLDQELSRGANPAECAQWAARAADLTSHPARVRAADQLEGLARFADEPVPVVWIGPHPAALRANRARLNELVELVRDPAPVYAHGLAMLRLLLTDGAGPLYADPDGTALSAALEQLHAALTGGIGRLSPLD